MPTLFDMLNQSPQAIDQLARQFNLSQQQAQQAVEALMPAFSQGLKQTTSDPYGFGNFLQALASGQHAKYYEDAGRAFSPAGQADGNGILGHLFGSKDLSRAVAAQASQATGIAETTLRQMLPALATMIMGGLFQQTAGQPRAAQAGGFGAGDGNILGDIIKEMMKQGQQQQPRAPQPQPQAPDAGDNPLGQVLKDIFGGGAQQQEKPAPRPQRRQAPQMPGGSSGNPLEQILKDMFGGGAQQQPQGQPRGRQQAPDPRGQNPFGDNPLGKIFEEMMRGGGTPQADPSQDHEERADRTPQQPRGRQPQRNPYEDIFGKMRESGTRQSEEYQRGVESIFEQYKRGMDRYR